MIWTKHHIARHNLWLHAGFWTAWVVFFSLLQSLGQDNSSLLIWFWYYLITLPVFAVHTYLVAYWLVPETFLKRRYGWFVAGLILLLVVFSVMELLISNEFIFKWLNPSMASDEEYLKPGNVIISGIGNHYIILVFMSVKVGTAWYHAQVTEQEEKQRNMETTLETYSYQFQPRVVYHLMLLLGCAIKKDLKKSSELIILISGFLNAFLNEKNRQEENLTKEIKLLEMYLEIFSAAIPDLVKTEFVSEGNFTEFQASDFLFLPVVDNALNSCKWCNNPCRCSVSIREENGNLRFSMYLSSEKKIDQPNDFDSEMLSTRLQNKFQGSISMTEEKSDTFWKLEADVFRQ